MARGRMSSGSGLGLDLEWSGFGDGFIVPDEVLTRQDKDKIADIVFDGVYGRAPVVTGKFRASLVKKVLTRSVNVRSKTKYMKKLDYDMGRKGKPFAHISTEDIRKIELIAEEALEAFLDAFEIDTSGAGRAR